MEEVELVLVLKELRARKVRRARRVRRALRVHRVLETKVHKDLKGQELELKVLRVLQAIKELRVQG
jgi:hypothetical protein